MAWEYYTIPAEHSGKGGRFAWAAFTAFKESERSSYLSSLGIISEEKRTETLGKRCLFLDVFISRNPRDLHSQ